MNSKDTGGMMSFDEWFNSESVKDDSPMFLAIQHFMQDAFEKGKEEGIKEGMERKESYIADIEQQLAGYREIVAIVLDLNEINETDAIIRDKYGIK